MESDLFYVQPEHRAIHLDLLNWASWVRPRNYPQQHPMWRKSRSNAFQWHVPVIRDQVRPLDAQALEKKVAKLPRDHGDALRWWYVYQYGEKEAKRRFARGRDELCKLVRNARQMLINRV